MPHSDPATKEPTLRAVRLMIEQTDASVFETFSVLDCGVGAGFIGRTLRSAALPVSLALTGVEIYKPYIERGKIRDRMEVTTGHFHHLYDSLLCADFVQHLGSTPEKSVDVVIFGDSLDHVDSDQALKSLARARRVGRYGVVVNAPIVRVAPVSAFGNEQEKKQFAWSRQEWERQGGIYLGGNAAAGCFLFLPKT